MEKAGVCMNSGSETEVGGGTVRGHLGERQNQAGLALRGSCFSHSFSLS